MKKTNNKTKSPLSLYRHDVDVGQMGTTDGLWGHQQQQQRANKIKKLH